MGSNAEHLAEIRVGQLWRYRWGNRREARVVAIDGDYVCLKTVSTGRPSRTFWTTFRANYERVLAPEGGTER